METALHRRQRDGKHGRSLLSTEPFEIAECQYLLVFGRQLAPGRVQQVVPFTSDRKRLRISSPAGTHAEFVNRNGVNRLFRDARPPGERRITCNRQQPRADAGITTETIDVLPRREKRLLQDVFGIIATARQQVSQTKHAGLVSLHERAKRFDITRRGSLHELLICQFFAFAIGHVENPRTE